jgi:hypothetical protein
MQRNDVRMTEFERSRTGHVLKIKSADLSWRLSEDVHSRLNEDVRLRLSQDI